MAAPGDSRLAAARRDPNLERRVRLARLKRARTRIERIVAAWPPFTPDELAGLAELLHPGGKR
jgi:hypothetical protein